MNGKNIFKQENTKLYLIIIACLIVIIAFYQPILALLWAIALGYLIYKYIKTMNKKEEKWIKYVEGLSKQFDSATKHAVFNMPFPLAMLEEDGSISWYNTRFIDMMEEESILNKNIQKLIPEIDIEEILKTSDKEPLIIEYRDNYYEIHYNIVEDKKAIETKGSIIMLYWVDITKKMELKNLYDDEEAVVCLAYIDNYDEVKSNTPDISRPIVLAEIDKIISAYMLKHGGIVRKYENDKYLLIFNKRALNLIQEKKFAILDEIREIDKGNTMSITLSMGIGIYGEDLNKSYEYATSAIDIALGRGGNQAVVKENNHLSFYGGKTKAVEKRNKVRSRVISHALRQLIDQSEEVFVMGHKNSDMDSFGASIGIMRATKDRNKKGYMVLAGSNPSIKNIYDRMEEEAPEYLDIIISPEEAEEMVNESSLLVVVDNHKPSFTEVPEILELTDKIVLIDHHRRGAEFIEDPILTYLESYASSTCELVTEILYYMSDKVEMSKFEADALLAGITVDTKNFTFQTGVRTFEAASILKRAGADTASVREFFKDDFQTSLNKAEVIRSSQIVFENVIIGRLERDEEDSVLLAAQVADELLNINDIDASFVLTLFEKKVHISGRSLGDISVQIILERLGGGGHLTSAGTQIEGATIEEAEDMLIKEIDEYLKEGGEK